jgi:hypothetical protein
VGVSPDIPPIIGFGFYDLLRFRNALDYRDWAHLCPPPWPKMTATIQRFCKAREKTHGETELAIALGTVDFLAADRKYIVEISADDLAMPMDTYDENRAARRVEALGSFRGLKAKYEELKRTATDPNNSKNILAKLDVTIAHMADLVEADKALAAAGETEEGEAPNDQPGTSEGDTPSRRKKVKSVVKKRRMLSSSQLTARRLKRALIKASLAGPATKKAKPSKPSYSEVTDIETARAIQMAKCDSRVDSLTGVVKELANTAINNGEEQTALRREQGQLRDQIQDVRETTEYLNDKMDEVRAEQKLLADNMEELKANNNELSDLLYAFIEQQNQYMTADTEMATEGVIPPTTTAQAHLGSAKPMFPKYTASTDIDIYFDSVERYFRLCGTDESYHIDYTLLAIPQFSTWWQAHVVAHPLAAHSWDTFKTTIKQFLMKEDPHTAAMGKLLRIRQNDMSVADYCTRFMQLVRDSNCQPTDQWLPVHLLQNMNDTSLIRAASSNNGQKWHNITDLVQHLNTITALRPSFTTRNNGKQGTDHKQRGRGAGQFRGSFGRGNGSSFRGGYNPGFQGRGESGFGRGRGRSSFRARGSGGRGFPLNRGERAPGSDRPQTQGDGQQANPRFNAASTSTEHQQRRANSPAPKRDQTQATIEHLKQTLAMLSGNK